MRNRGERNAERDMRELAALLKSVRRLKHLSLAQISDETGISIARVSRIERGLAPLRVGDAVRIAAALVTPRAPAPPSGDLPGACGGGHAEAATSGELAR